MPDLKLMQSELEQALGRYRTLAAENGNNPPPAVAAEMATLHDRSTKLRDGIASEQEAVQRRDMAELDKWANEPSRQFTHHINDDDDGRREVLQKGWEIRAGMIHVPTSQGTLYPLMPETALFGPLPTEPDEAEWVRVMRASVQPVYRAAYERFLRTSVKFRSEAMALIQLPAAEQRALAEGTDSTGGALVPPDIQADMLQRTAQQSVMRRLGRVITTSRDKVSFPAVAPHATASLASIYSSGFVGGWVGETPAFSETDPAFQNFEVAIKKARVATKLSNDFISDAVNNVLAWLSANGAENLALVEDAGFIAGLGTPLEPLGILNAGISTVDVEGTTANTISNTAADLGSATKLITNVAYAVPSAYASRGSWLMARATEGKIRALTSGNLGYATIPATSQQFGAWDRTLLGAPVFNSDFVPIDGTNANKVVVYGDFGNYIIAQRAQLTTVLLRERFADTDQVGIIIFERAGGGVWNTDAFRIGVV